MTPSTASSIRAFGLNVLKASANIAVILAFGLLAIASYREFAETGSLKSIGLVAVNTLFVCMYVLRREAKSISTTPGQWFLAFGGTIVPMLMRPSEAGELTVIGHAVQMLGMCLIVAALLSLQRSFGIVPANRGIQDGGLYRFMRHPLYAAELLTLLGFVLTSPSARNVLVWVVLCGLQFLRARAEENFLCADPAYRAYRDRVRYRLVPGLI
jgi:protein-S-isoprenylcysteine O-methyltransferase Ste14